MHTVSDKKLCFLRLGMGIGLKGPAGSWVDDFPCAHTGQGATKVSWDIEGHYNHCWRKQRVQTRLG